MDAKTIVAIRACGVYHRCDDMAQYPKQEEEVTRFCRNGAACHNEPPFSYLYGGVR